MTFTWPQAKEPCSPQTLEEAGIRAPLRAAVDSISLELGSVILTSESELRPEREWMPVVLIHEVWGNLLQQPWETNTLIQIFSLPLSCQWNISLRSVIPKYLWRNAINFKIKIHFFFWGGWGNYILLQNQSFGDLWMACAMLCRSVMSDSCFTSMPYVITVKVFAGKKKTFLF